MPTTTYLFDKKWLWPVVLSATTLLALVLRWYYVNTAVVLSPVRGDATQYYAYAWNLVHNGVFSTDVPGTTVFNPDNYRDPGYPFFLALWMKVMGTGDDWYSAVLQCQALLGALTVTIATQFGKHWLPPRWAIAAGLLMAVWPHSITINGYLLTETLFGFLCALGLLLCARAYMRRSIWWATAAGVTLGAAALTNAVLLPFGILLAGFLAWRRLTPRKICVALAIGTLLLPGAWALRNSHIPAPAPENSSRGRALQNLVQGAWPDFHKAYRASIFGDEATRAKAHDALDAIYKENATLQASFPAGARAIAHRMAEHPWRYAAWYVFEKPYELWNWDIVIGQGDIYVYPTRNAPFQNSRPWMALASVCRALNPLLMVLAMASLLVVWPKQRPLDIPNRHVERTVQITTICLLAFATAVYTALQAEPRYSIPFRPFEMLLAITSLCAIATRQRKRKEASSYPSSNSRNPKSTRGS